MKTEKVIPRRGTGKWCSCNGGGGEIMEFFHLADNSKNGQSLQSFCFGCEKCSSAYTLPGFIPADTSDNSDIWHQHALQKITFANAITSDDFFGDIYLGTEGVRLGDTAYLISEPRSEIKKGYVRVSFSVKEDAKRYHISESCFE